MKYQIKDGNIARIINVMPFGLGGEIREMTDEEYKTYQESLVPKKTYSELRAEEYGSVSQQMEFITENGLEAWQEKVKQIKSKYPKEV